MSEKSLNNLTSLKKVPTLKYNKTIYNRSHTTKIDKEKAYYEAKLLLEEEDLSRINLFLKEKILIFLNFFVIYSSQLIGFIFLLE
jgi:hypothetical protein